MVQSIPSLFVPTLKSAVLRLVTAGAVWLLSFAAIADEAPTLPCGSSPDIADIVFDIDPRTTDCDRGDPCWLENLDRARLLAERYPYDIAVQRVYQMLVRYLPRDEALDGHREQLSEVYAHRLEANPEDPAAIYLSARLELDRQQSL